MATEKKSVYDKLHDGDYENKLPWLSKAKDDAVHQAYDAEENRLTAQFRVDAAEECGVLGHKNEPKLWDLAWSHGHSSGYSEVWNYYQEFSDLLK